MTLLICGSITAQDHYSFNSHDFEKQMIFRAEVYIDGVFQNSENIEIGAFDGDVCTCTKRISRASATSSYYRANMTIGGNGTYALTFKLYDHENNVELLDYTLCDPEGNSCTEFSWQEGTFGTWKNSYKLYFTTTTTKTFTKTINGYNESKGGYYLIASPIDSLQPSEVEGMIADIENNYDLYAFDEAYEYEWRNFKAGHFTTLECGKGYLYASKITTELKFTGTPYNGDGKVVLHKTAGAEFEGWNLVGNPFDTTAYIADGRDFYIMNPGGTGFIEGGTEIAVMEGVLVVANSDGEEMHLTTTPPTKANHQIAVNVSQESKLIDRAVVRLNDTKGLPKLQLNENSTKIYIPRNGKDYAIIKAESEDVIPVHFKAETNGTYTISINTEGLDVDYMHLIDNMTGADIDLLKNSTYSFDAKTTDYESRFKLMFSTDTDAHGESFAFISDGKIIVNNADANTKLQVVDMLGRVLVQGNATEQISTENMTPGVYVVRLLNGENTTSQKIVVK